MIASSTNRFLFMLAFLTLLSVCFIGASKASAASYYINNQVTCNDANAGTSTGSPWCNISNVTGKTFAAGDQILLARGATWTSQTMSFTNSGISSSYITLDAYGTGAKPKIVGTGLATDRAVKWSNASYWNISNLEISRVGAGIYFNYTTKSHEGINISNIYIHHINGIVKGVPSNSDNIFFSSGIYFTGNALAVGSTDYVVRNVKIDGVEGTHNQDSIAIDWNNGGGLGGSTNPENAMQNLTMNHLYLHDDDGHDGAYQSTSCSDSVRFVGSSNVTMMNSYLNNEASCYSSSGTAAIFSGISKNIKYINNIISNVPNTGSPDLTGLDLEIMNDSMKFYSNYWAGNAGAGFELLLINGASDWCSNNDIGGNIFVANGNGGIEAVGNGGGVTNATGIIHDNIYNGSTAFKTTNGGSFSSMTETNTVTIPSAANIYSAPIGFTGTQNTGGSNCTSGSNCWSYQLYNGSSYSNLTYDSTNVWWGSSTGNVSKFEAVPNSTSSNWVSHAWTAPNNGIVSIRGRVLKSDISGGDGVKAKITQNGSVIWPTGGTPQTIAYNDQSGYDTFLDSIAVAAGDVIRFEVNNGGSANSSNDATSWAPTVAYTNQSNSGETYAYDWGFNTAGNSEGWTNGNDISQSVSGGLNTLTASGTDPYIFSADNLNFSASTYKNVKIRLKNTTSSTVAEVFFTTTTDTTFTQAKSTRLTITANDTGYTEYVFDLSTNAAWTGTVKQLRFDPVAATGIVYVDYVRVSNKGPSGTGLELNVTNSGAAVANRYIYKKFSSVAYTFQSGDYIEYDVKLMTNVYGSGGIDLYNTDGSYFRDSSGWADQNGISGHPGSDLTANANNQWYHRVLAVPASMIGKTSSYWLLSGENDTASLAYKVQYDNIVVTHAGSTVATAFASSADYNLTGDPLTSGITSSSITTPNVLP